MLSRLTRRTLLIACACLLAGCGFHLRGTGGEGGAALPEDWKSMHLVNAEPNSELTREVQSTFTANEIQWLPKDQANYQLVLGPERFKQTNLALNAEARVSEYELEMLVKFSVLDGKGAVVMPETDASVLRQMENDPRNPQGKADEVRILRGEMRSELAQQVIRRIRFFATRTP